MALTKRIITIIILLTALTISITACAFTEPTIQEMRGSIPPLKEGETELLEEQVILDLENVQVTALALRKATSGNYMLFINVGNGFDFDIIVNMEDASVNGIMVEDRFFLRVDAGRKAQDRATFELITSSGSSLTLQGVAPEVYEIEFRLSIRHGDTLDEIFLSDVISLKTTAYGGEQLFDDSGRVIFDDGEIRIIERELAAGFQYSLSGDVYVEYFVENLSNIDVEITAYYLSVNGYWVKAISGRPVITAGSRSYNRLFIKDSDFLEIEDDILYIEEIGFSFRIWNYDREGSVEWSGGIYYDTDEVVLTYDSIPRYPPDEPDEDEYEAAGHEGSIVPD